MDLTFLIDHNVKLTNPKWVKEQIGNYVEACTTPTFLGLLNYMGITRHDFRELQELVAQQNKGAIKVMRYLELFKNKIESNIIEWMTYQDSHPDLQGRNIDYKALQWVYDKQNPTIVNSQNNNSKKLKYDLTNDSGHLENND